MIERLYPRERAKDFKTLSSLKRLEDHSKQMQHDKRKYRKRSLFVEENDQKEHEDEELRNEGERP